METIIKKSILLRMISDTFIAIRTVGFWDTSKLYISNIVDRLLDFNSKYDFFEPLNPRDTIPNHSNVEYATIYVPTRVRPFIKMLNS